MRSHTFSRFIGLIGVLFISLLLLVGCHKNVNSDAAQHNMLITKMYQYLGKLKHHEPQLSDMKRFYTKDVVMITNGQAVAQGYQGFYQHFKMMIRKTRNFRFMLPRHAMIAAGNKVAVQYKLVLHTKHAEKLVHVIAIFTFENSKISTWNEVVSADTPKKILAVD